MKPKDLYARKPEYETDDIQVLKGCYFDHIPEIDEYRFRNIELGANKKILIKVYKDFDFDGRRGWRLASIWFDNFPIMIIQNAGRELDDHERRFITDENKYALMIQYIALLLPTEDGGVDVVSDDTDIDDLTCFYGHELDGVFRRYYE